MIGTYIGIGKPAEGPNPSGDGLLLETMDFLITENGEYIIME
jgi:hypothetical protein